jgi:hypothetical protein
MGDYSMKFNPKDFTLYKQNVSFDEKMKHEITKEIASTLGRYGNKIETAVEKQRKILEQLKDFVVFNEKQEISCQDIERMQEDKRKEVLYLIQEYNQNYEAAQKYQYYLNIQKEALKLRGFDYDPYNILPRIKT